MGRRVRLPKTVTNRHNPPYPAAMSAPHPFSPTSPLGDALVILAAAGIVIPVFARFRITPVIGFILVGLLVGPFGLGGLERSFRGCRT